MRVLSIDEENLMLKIAIEYFKNNVLAFEERILFLTSYTNAKQRMIRCETLLKRKFCDRDDAYDYCSTRVLLEKEIQSAMLIKC